MRYLFFDIEGANCFNYVNKMCTFGYVITNTSFKVVVKIDVVMNPESPFDKHIIQEKMNAYPLEKYKTSPSFPFFYNSIRNNLEWTNQIICGWSIENDVKYIYDSCSRYHLPQIKYEYIDIQAIYKEVFNLANQPGLEAAAVELGIKNVIYHKSDDDALLTMKITKKLCEKLNLTLEELVIKYKKYVSSTKTYAKEKAMSYQERQNKIAKRNALYSINKYVSKTKRQNENIHENDVFAFASSVLDKSPQFVRQVARYIKDCGAKCTNNYSEATILVSNNIEVDKASLNHHKNLKLMTLKKLLAISKDM